MDGWLVLLCRLLCDFLSRLSVFGTADPFADALARSAVTDAGLGFSGEPLNLLDRRATWFQHRSLISHDARHAGPVHGSDLNLVSRGSSNQCSWSSLLKGEWGLLNGEAAKVQAIPLLGQHALELLYTRAHACTSSEAGGRK